MGLVTWILLAVIVLVAIGLGVGVFFTGLFRGAEIVGENPTVQNATEEAKDFIDDRVDSALVIASTERSDYQRGDAVLITVKNNGEEKKSFPDAALGLQVQNADTGTSYNVMSAQVITDLDPGESKTITWQDDSAPAGNYVASVHTSDGDSAQVSFEIRE
jgi:archaellum component FlaF (FlaF/FlaG flagellin family)